MGWRLTGLAIATFFLIIPSHYASVFCQGKKEATFVYRTELGVYDPSIYAERLKLQITLVDLPGISDKRSYWEVSYQVFFIPEASYQEAIKHLPVGGSNPSPMQFPGRMLLAEGSFKNNNLSINRNRIEIKDGIPFKEKVSDKERLRFARIMMSYSLKIYDAKLNKNIYRTGTFADFPFNDEMAQNGKYVPREQLYMTFSVLPNGELTRSRLPPEE